MQIGVPKETLSGERRVAILPDAAARLVKAGPGAWWKPVQETGHW